MKKILSLFLCVCIFLSLFSVISYANCEAYDRRETDEYYWDPSIVIVTIKKEHMRVGGMYYPYEFSEELVEEIQPISYVEEGKENHPLYNNDDFRDVMALVLKEPSDENVLLLIEILKDNPIVENAQRNLKTNVIYPTAFTVGDADCDGNITASDARFVLRCSVNLEEYTDLQKKISDANDDGYLTAADARIILRYSVGLYEYSLESLLVKVKDGYIPENYDVTPEFFGNELISRVEYIGQGSSFCVYLNAPGQKNLFELKAYLENSEMIEYTEFNYIGYLA